MTTLSVQMIDQSRVSDQDIAAWSASNAALGRAYGEWATAWAAYRKTQLLGGGHVGERVLRFAFTVPTGDADVPFTTQHVEITFGPDFMQQLVWLYAAHGWTGVAAMLAQLPTLTLQARAMIEKAVVTLEGMIAQALIRMEQVATAVARDQNDVMLAQAEEYFRSFHDLTVEKDGEDHHITRGHLLPGPQTDAMIAKLKALRRILKKIEPLNAEVAERRSKDGGDPETVRRKRARDAYRRKLAEIWETPLKAELQAMLTLQEELAAIFPPALMIVDDLTDTIFNWQETSEAKPGTVSGRASSAAENHYEAAIYDRCVELRETLGWIATSLDNPGLGATIMRALGGDPHRRWEQGGLHRIAIVEATRLASLLTDAQSYFSLNRVMGRDKIMIPTLDRVIENQRGSFDQAVLHNHLMDLTRFLEAERKDDAFYDSLFHRIEQFAAFAVLLASLLTLVLGPEAVAVPAAVASFVSGFSTASSLLMLVVMARGIAQVLGEVDPANSEIAAALLNDGILDMAAVAEVGTLICRQRRALKAVTVDIVKELVALAIAGKVKPLAFALHVRGHLYDMQTLGIPLG